LAHAAARAVKGCPTDEAIAAAVRALVDFADAADKARATLFAPTAASSDSRRSRQNEHKRWHTCVLESTFKGESGSRGF
jgi:hypothetical protein